MPAGRIERVVGRIERAQFTGKADLQKVVSMYKSYVQTMVAALQPMLAVLSGSSEVGSRFSAPPSIATPLTPPVRFASGQLLLFAPAAHSPNGGNALFKLGTVQREGRRIILVGDKMDEGAEVSLDQCSHLVLPWRKPAEGWEVALCTFAASLLSLSADMDGMLANACANEQVLSGRQTIESLIGKKVEAALGQAWQLYSDCCEALNAQSHQQIHQELLARIRHAFDVLQSMGKQVNHGLESSVPVSDPRALIDAHTQQYIYI